TQFGLGRALELQGDLEGAYRRYGLAVLRDPYWPIPVAAVAQLSAQRGRWEDAEGAAAGWVRLSPGVVDAWALLIQSRLRRLERIAPGLRAEAAETTAEVAGEARKRFPDDPRFGVWLAQALRRAGRDEAARAEIDRLAGPDAPGSDDVWVAVETARFHALGDLARGLTEARAAVDRFPDEASAHALLAEVAYGAGAVEEADRATARARERAPDEVEPLRVRCRFRVATGRFSGAVEDCRRVLSANEADPEVHFWLGTALANTGQAEGAIAVYRRAIELDPEDFRPHNNLADLLARAGRTEEALDAAQEAYRLSEGNPYVADTVATLYLERGFGSRAVSLLEDAHAAIPDVPSVRLNLARAYVAVDQRDRAEALVAAWSNTPEGSPHAGTVREILSLESARAE
ncbi:MAG: tetratricopeptide repeat protein, partial [Myxococcota bacterium]